MVPVPTGDLVAAHQATGIPNVTIYTAEFPASPAVRATLPVVQRLLAVSAIRRGIERLVDRRSDRPAARRKDPARPSYLWAKATDRNGKAVEAWLEMGEGYQFTAVSSVLAVERILATQLAGALTPAQAFGADFLLEIPGTRRYDTFGMSSRVV